MNDFDTINNVYNSSKDFRVIFNNPFMLNVVANNILRNNIPLRINPKILNDTSNINSYQEFVKWYKKDSTQMIVLIIFFLCVTSERQSLTKMTKLMQY